MGKGLWHETEVIVMICGWGCVAGIGTASSEQERPLKYDGAVNEVARTSRPRGNHHPPPSLPPCSQPDPSISLPLYDSDPNLSPTSPRTALRLIPRTKQSPSRPPVGQRYPIVAPDRTHASSKFSHNTAKNANQSYPLAREDPSKFGAHQPFSLSTPASAELLEGFHSKYARSFDHGSTRRSGHRNSPRWSLPHGARSQCPFATTWRRETDLKVDKLITFTFALPRLGDEMTIRLNGKALSDKGLQSVWAAERKGDGWERNYGSPTYQDVLQAPFASLRRRAFGSMVPGSLACTRAAYLFKRLPGPTDPLVTRFVAHSRARRRPLSFSPYQTTEDAHISAQQDLAQAATIRYGALRSPSSTRLFTTPWLHRSCQSSVNACIPEFHGFYASFVRTYWYEARERAAGGGPSRFPDQQSSDRLLDGHIVVSV
ncbi:hypothetical protein FA13DRAFT_1777348 [Coprinellus micaceus]|uniref:Uncharacterized protein n=1 Tax=Coprinellus micaceus TaxID=71717 RepID=A0A4Y7SVM3_COPMI|nr:hypothetical protein FA13DRAFT_1777348 [Coprinellus micaceus]